MNYKEIHKIKFMKQKMNIIGKQIKMGTKRNLSLEFYSSKSWHVGISFIGCVELNKIQLQKARTQ